MAFGKKKYFKVIPLVILIVVLVIEIGLGINLNRVEYSVPEENLAIKTNVEPIQEDLVAVEIKGQVLKPGVYLLKKEATINDVIEEAGGLLEEAYSDNINLSQKIMAQMVIKVFSQKEYQKLDKPNNYEICYVNSFDISSCLKNGFSVIVTDKEQAPTINNTESNDATETSKNSQSTTKVPTIVNINTASKDALMTLNGIGEAKATAIIEYRKTNGNFKTIEEIKNVKGIGDAIYAKIKQYLKV